MDQRLRHFLTAETRGTPGTTISLCAFLSICGLALVQTRKENEVAIFPACRTLEMGEGKIRRRFKRRTITWR
jgi:hypothetical protein